MNKLNTAVTGRIPTVLVLLILITCFDCGSQVAAQQRDKRIEGIRRLETEINSQIALNDKEELAAPVFRNQLVVNANEHPWPVVGIYKSVIRFYYTFSGREGEPYPNKLLKITVETRRSDRGESAEYLFNAAGQLVFCLAKNEGDSQEVSRYYFAGRRLIGLSKDQQSSDRFTPEQLTAARDWQKEALRLKGIFSVVN